MKKSLLGVSVITIAALYGILGILIVAVFALLDLPMLIGIAIGAGIVLLQFLINPWLTDLNMKWFYKATFKREIPAYLTDFINEVCAEKKMKAPKIGFIDDGAPNAFTYGHTKNDARIVLTRGIFEMLDEEEVKAVVAHELGHACHYDMLLMTVVQLVPFVLHAIYEALSDSDSDNGAVGAVSMIALVLYVISEYIILGLSRTREYFADEFSAQTTKNPNALSSALVKIGFGLSTRERDKKIKHPAGGDTTLGIADTKSSRAYAAATASMDGEASPEAIRRAMRWDMWNVWAKWFEFTSTHPLTAKRILALGKLAPAFGQVPYVEFDEKPDRSYVGMFVGELIISALPVILAITAVISGVIGYIAGSSLYISIGFAGLALACGLGLVKYHRRHPKGFTEKTVGELLGEAAVSHVTPIPCVLKGELIGRGDPGCIFCENFVIHDETGILLLNYNQPLKLLDKIFALFSAEGYIDKHVKVTGWYRRGPIPFMDMESFETEDGTVKKLRRHTTNKILLIVGTVLFALLAVGTFFLL